MVTGGMDSDGSQKVANIPSRIAMEGNIFGEGNCILR